MRVLACFKKYAQGFHHVVQLPSHVQLFQPHGLQHSRSLTISQSLAKFMSIVSVMPSSHLIIWHLLVLLPSIFPSIRVFSNESGLLIRWAKYWSFSISLSIEYSGLIGLISLLSKGLSRVFSSTTVWMHWFFSAQASLQSNFHIHICPQEKP